MKLILNLCLLVLVFITPLAFSQFSASELSKEGTIVFTVNGKAHIISNGELTNISDSLDSRSNGQDGFINVSPDGEWFIMSSTRFEGECANWRCWFVTNKSFDQFHVLQVNGRIAHSGGAAAILSGGGVVIIESDQGPNRVDLFAIEIDHEARSSKLTLLTGDSPYPYNKQPAISDDGQQLVFDCGYEPYGGTGSAICESNILGEAFRVVISPDDTSNGMRAADFLHHADYAPNGDIVFEGDWSGEQLWLIEKGNPVPQEISRSNHNDNSPCVLPNGNIVSLWLNRPGGRGYHEVKQMTLDGRDQVMMFIGEDVKDVGLGCGM